MLQSQPSMGSSLENISSRIHLIAQERRERPSSSPRITVVGDRETENLKSIIRYGNQFPEALQLGGIIFPGGEIDDRVIGIVDRVHTMLSEGIGIPIAEGDASYGMHFLSPGVEISFNHAPYDSAALRNDPSYRKAYCKKLADLIGSTWPDIVFLSNFKVILDPLVVERFAGKIVNVHPSVLPLLKGFRPELRADSGESPEAAGYTIHLVDTGLDGGHTLFQQHISIDPYDAQEEERLGKNEYVKRREESLRLKIITAEARYSPFVLAMVASPTTRKVLEDKDAFTAEQREGFFESEIYQSSLQEDYEEWKKDKNVYYEEWFTHHRKPYQRVVFDIGKGWQTLEQIAQKDIHELQEKPFMMAQYNIRLKGDNGITMERFFELITAAQSRNDGQFYSSRSTYDKIGVLYGSIITSVDFSQVLEEAGIEYTVEPMPTRVGARRKEIRWEQEETLQE